MSRTPHTIVMTGASRGIGRVAAEHLLAEDPDVHLVVVARGPGAQLAAELSDTAGREVSQAEADLGSLDSVAAAAHTIRKRIEVGELPPLTGFVGNAGIQYTNATTETPDGLEATFAVNVLANHLFLRVLEPVLDTPARVVVTASDTHFGDLRHNLGLVPGPRWLAPDTLARPGAFPNPDSVAAGRTAYSTSKLAAIYLVHEYARRLRPGVDIVSYNPGFVPGTDLARHANAVQRFLVRRVLPAMVVTPIATSRGDAGRYLAELALGESEGPSGRYVDRRSVVPSSDESYDPAREAELWACLDRLAGPHLR